MARSLAVLAFIGLIAAAAVLVSQRPTIARGDVLAADLMAANTATLKSLDCDPRIPIGIDGARFSCRAEFKLGSVQRLDFKMDRTGAIKQIGEHALGAAAPDPAAPPQRIDKSDPWSD